MDQINYEISSIKMSSLSRSFGIASLAAAILAPDLFFISAGFGFFAILMAFLSKGYSLKLNPIARLGAILGAIAIVIDVSIVGLSTYVMLKNPEMLKEALKSAEEITNVSTEELYGRDINGLIDELLGGNSNGK